MTRQKLMVANWKMFTTSTTARQLAVDVAKGVGRDTGIRVAVCPPFVFLNQVDRVLAGTPIGLGGGYARAGIRFWPGRVVGTDSTPA